MHKKKEEFSTIESKVISEISPLEASVIVIEKNQRSVKFYLERCVRCESQKNIKFVAKMVGCLSSNKNFVGTVHLQEPSEEINSTKLSYFNEEESLRHSAALMSRHRICYRFSYYIEAESQYCRVAERMKEFRQRCDAIHSKIEQYNSRYRIENRINYWAYLLTGDINKWFGRQEKEERSYIDQPKSIFDSN